MPRENDSEDDDSDDQSVGSNEDRADSDIDDFNVNIVLLPIVVPTIDLSTFLAQSFTSPALTALMHQNFLENNFAFTEGLDQLISSIVAKEEAQNPLAHLLPPELYQKFSNMETSEEVHLSGLQSDGVDGVIYSN